MKRVLSIFLIGVFVISIANFAGFALAESNQPAELTAATETPAPMATPGPTTKPTTKKKHHRRHKHPAPAPAATPAPQ
jgi:hypothetical protein